MVRPSPPVDAASQPATSLVIATANVLTLYPQEEAQGETWAPSARRVALAKRIREVGVEIEMRRDERKMIFLMFLNPQTRQMNLLKMFRKKIPLGRIVPPFFFESSESDRFFFLHDSNSIFR